jgi:hypothetical protein
MAARDHVEQVVRREQQAGLAVLAKRADRCARVDHRVIVGARLECGEAVLREDVLDLDPAAEPVALRLDPAEHARGRDTGNGAGIDDIGVDIVAEQVGVDRIAADLREPHRGVRLEAVIARVALLILEAGQAIEFVGAGQADRGIDAVFRDIVGEPVVIGGGIEAVAVAMRVQRRLETP